MSDAAKTIIWMNKVQILGIKFEISEDEEKNWRLNFDPALQKMRQVCTSWSIRHLSLKGKVVILNTLILPIIYYQCTMLPVTQRIFSAIEKIVASFVWNDKRPKISRLALEKTTALGGLGLHNIKNRVKASKIKWLKRLLKPPTEPWHFYFEFKVDNTGRDLALQRCRSRRLQRVYPFAAEIYTYWSQLQRNEPSSEESIRNEGLWGNTFLRGKVKKKHETFAKKLGINKINDLLDMGRIMTEANSEKNMDVAPVPDCYSRWPALFLGPGFEAFHPQMSLYQPTPSI